jgi:hypothetical protein
LLGVSNKGFDVAVVLGLSGLAGLTICGDEGGSVFGVGVVATVIIPSGASGREKSAGGLKDGLDGRVARSIDGGVSDLAELLGVWQLQRRLARRTSVMAGVVLFKRGFGCEVEN